MNRLESTLSSVQATFYVSLDGNDQWSGTLGEPNADRTDGPFATLERAQSALRQLQESETAKDASSPRTVVVRKGIYELPRPLSFTQEDSGTPDQPVIWTAAPGEHVQLSAGHRMSGGQAVTDESVLSQLRPEVRDHILVFDLKANGITQYGTPNGDGAEIFWNDKPMTLSRYPNHGFIKITGLVEDGTHPIDIRGTKGILEGAFFFDDKQLLSWEKEKEIWVDGYWFWDWSNQRHRVESIDAATQTLRVKPPFHGYGYRTGQWFYAYNLLSEIDVPGEYYIDREAGLLYCYPLEEGDAVVEITVQPSVFQFDQVSHLILNGFTFELSREMLMKIDGGDDLCVTKSTFRNAGGAAVIGHGTNHWVFGCHLYGLGRGGIQLDGGDRKTLTPGHNVIFNNTIHDYARNQRTYAPGATIGGVGNYIGNNQISNAPHMGLGFSGNDELIEYNELFNVCYESNDAGAIYTGRNWTMRGNLLRYNYLHDINGFEDRGCVGIYLDDMFSSADMVGNLFVNVTRAAFIGGGRDNHIVNNVFLDCHPALHIDARCLGWCKDHGLGWIAEKEEKGTLSGIEWNQSPYRERYPELATLFDEGKNPRAPEGNVIAKNISYGGDWDYSHGQWPGPTIEEAARPFLTFENNLVDQDPKFQNPEEGDYRFQSDSPALSLGIEPLPVEKMGTFPHPLAVQLP